jgi:hypothetical protein
MRGGQRRFWRLSKSAVKRKGDKREGGSERGGEGGREGGRRGRREGGRKSGLQEEAPFRSVSRREISPTPGRKTRIEPWGESKGGEEGVREGGREGERGGTVGGKMRTTGT